MIVFVDDFTTMKLLHIIEKKAQTGEVLHVFMADGAESTWL